MGGAPSPLSRVEPLTAKAPELATNCLAAFMAKPMVLIRPLKALGLYKP